MSAQTLVEFKGAALGYGGRPVLRGVDLAVQTGTFWGVLGANGSGKTTILKTMLGLIPPVSGKVAARGRSGGAPRFGYVPQKERLDPLWPLSSFEVAAMGTHRRVELFARLRGVDRRDFVQSCLQACGAAALAKKPFSALSGGQKQRVLIARALAAEPEILVLDEPLSGIDVPTQLAILDLLEKLKTEHDLTVLMVSHRIRAERKLFTHIAWVDSGAVESGPADKMMESGGLASVFRGDL